MEKLLIITSYIEHMEKVDTEKLKEFDMIICADGGHLRAEELDIVPDRIIGDFDSSSEPENSEKNDIGCGATEKDPYSHDDLYGTDFKDRKVIRLPEEKDMTDTEAAIELAIRSGYLHISVLGGIGGRIDHTIGNMALLAKYNDSDSSLEFFDGINRLFILLPGKNIIKKDEYTSIGLVSYTPVCTGLTMKGFKYNTENLSLFYDTTLGISNTILDDEASIEFDQGKLLVAMSKIK